MKDLSSYPLSIWKKKAFYKSFKKLLSENFYEKLDFSFLNSVFYRFGKSFKSIELRIIKDIIDPNYIIK